jgi:hypothetical protein
MGLCRKGRKIRSRNKVKTEGSERHGGRKDRKRISRRS